MIYRHIFQDFRPGIEPEDFRTTEYADNAPSQARICSAKRGRHLRGKANSAKWRNSSKINPCFTKNAYKPIFLRRQRYIIITHSIEFVNPPKPNFRSAALKAISENFLFLYCTCYLTADGKIDGPIKSIK